MAFARSSVSLLLSSFRTASAIVDSSPWGRRIQYCYIRDNLGCLLTSSFSLLPEFELLHVDEFVDELLREDRACDIILPRIQKRNILEQTEQLEPRVSALEEDLSDVESEEEEEEEERVRHHLLMFHYVGVLLDLCAPCSFLGLSYM